MSGLVSSATVAAELGVTRSAVGNWLKRGILPENLRPVRLDKGKGAPAWSEDDIPALQAWHEGRHSRRWVTVDVHFTNLQPGDMVTRVRDHDLSGRDVLITVRRRPGLEVKPDDEYEAGGEDPYGPYGDKATGVPA